LAVRRSYTPWTKTPSRIRSIGRRGTPSKSNGVPIVSGDVASSRMVMPGAATGCPCLPVRHDRPSAIVRPPKPIHARNPTIVETALGSSTAVTASGARSRGRCDDWALPNARRPVAAGSISSARAEKASAKPLPPSPPFTTELIDACVEGAQQNWPSVLATATSIAIVSSAPAAR
jgi:hypothetical protein